MTEIRDPNACELNSAPTPARNIASFGAERLRITGLVGSFVGRFNFLFLLRCDVRGGWLGLWLRGGSGRGRAVWTTSSFLNIQSFNLKWVPFLTNIFTTYSHPIVININPLTQFPHPNQAFSHPYKTEAPPLKGFLAAAISSVDLAKRWCADC